MLGTRAERIQDLETWYPSWESLTVWERFDSCANICPDSVFLIFDTGEQATYREVKSFAEKLAQAFVAWNVHTGSRVALRLSNRLELIVALLALSKIGAIAVTLYPGTGKYETNHVLESAKAELFISETMPEFYEDTCPSCVRSVIVLDNDSSSVSPSTDQIGSTLRNNPLTVCWDEFLEQSGKGYQITVHNPYAYSNIIFTSGTTGNPKGVPLTADQILRNAFCNVLNRGFERGRRICIPLSLLHCFGFIEGFLSVLFVGGILLIEKGRFDAGVCISFMKRHKANDLFCMPIQMLRLIDYQKEHSVKLPDLHAIYCAGSVYPQGMAQDIVRYLGVEDVINGYGMSEIGGAVIQTIPGDSPEVFERKVGKILPAGCAGLPEYDHKAMCVKIVDPQTGKECPTGTAGEVWFKGAAVMEGYYGISSSDDLFADGWLKSGDLAFIDEAGYVELVGRIKDSYRINGENVSTHFIETIVEKCPLVHAAVVLGIEDKRLGAVGALFVELTQDTPDNRETLKQYCQESLARFQVPKYYVFLSGDEWPTTSSGKIKETQLKQMVIDNMF